MKTCRSGKHQYSKESTRCPICYREVKTKLRIANKEYNAAKKKEYDLAHKEHYKQYKEIHKDKHKEQYQEYREANRGRLAEYQRKWISLNKDKHETWHKNNREVNRGRYNAATAKRRARKLNATPKWLSKEQLEEIKQIYILAANTFDENSNHYHVDHIVPLQGKNVSGLHVPWNLQILPAKENARKGNKVNPKIIQ